MANDLTLPARTRHLRRLSDMAAIRFRLRAAVLAAHLERDAEEQKFNPNHDEQGRFASGPGGDAERQARRVELAAAQDKAMNNPKFRTSNPTHCNQATLQILEDVGAPVHDLTDAQGRALSANDMADALATSRDYREITSAEATQLANDGHPVLVSWKNPGGDPTDTHGHIATVRPEGISGDQVPPGAKPILANVGGKRTRVMPQSGAIGTSRPGRVRYYTPVLRGPISN